MSPHEPFTGVLLLPDKAYPHGTSAVYRTDGEVLAHVRWHALTVRGTFEILDPTQTAELARGMAVGFTQRRYVLNGRGGEQLLELKLGWRGPAGRCTVKLPGRITLTTTGNWTERRFQVSDGAGRLVARIDTTSAFFSLRPDSYAFEMALPVLSVVQAVGLAQCIREAVHAQNSN